MQHLTPEEVQRVYTLSNPMLQQKQIEKWRVIAGVCISLVVGGFSAALWLQANFESKDEGTELKHAQVELTRNVNQLTLQVTKLTTLEAAQGKILDETRKDVKELQTDVRAMLPPRARRAAEARPSRPEPAPFADALRQVNMED